MFSLSKENLNNINIQSKIIEGIVLNHLIKFIIENTESNIIDYKDKIFYWKNKQKTKEVDFVVKLDGIHGLEVKWQNQINKSDIKILREFKNSIILSKQNFIKTKAIPLGCFLLVLDKWLKK